MSCHSPGEKFTYGKKHLEIKSRSGKNGEGENLL